MKMIVVLALPLCLFISQKSVTICKLQFQSCIQNFKLLESARYLSQNSRNLKLAVSDISQEWIQ